MDDLVYNPPTNKIILDRSVPGFVHDHYPLFEAFLDAYYEWLEQRLGPSDIIKNIRQYRDIDTTIDEFVDSFRTTYLRDLPSNVLADKRLLVKHIKRFYQNKGNEASFKFLFRILFNEDIQFYYPKVDILKCSDGVWIQTTAIKVVAGSMTLNNIPFFFTSSITGGTSHSFANVQSITSYNEEGIDILELSLIDVSGAFIPGEEIILSPMDTNAPSPIYVHAVYNGVDIINGGGRYQVGDPANIVDEFDNVLGTANITIVDRGPVIGLNILDAGVNYNGDQREIVDFYYLPFDYEYSGQNTYNSDFTTDSFDLYNAPGWSFGIPTVLIPGTGDNIQIDDTPDPIGQGAGGHVVLVSQSGGILEVQLDTGGVNYNIPIATVISSTGTGADIEAVGGGGNIQGIQLNDFPLYLTDSFGQPSNPLFIDFSPASGTGAIAELTGPAGSFQYPGYYLNTNGQPSSDKKLEDNYFYQDYSYVILSSISQTRWQDKIKKIIHPAGLINFGLLKYTAEFPQTISTIVETVQKELTGTYGELLISDTVNHVEISNGGRLLISLSSTITVEMPADSGSYSVTGHSPQLGHSWSVGYGVYTITGEVEFMYKNYAVLPSYGVYS